MVAALPMQYTRSMYSDVPSARVCKLSTSMILPSYLDICLFFAEMRMVGMEVLGPEGRVFRCSGVDVDIVIALAC